MDRLRGALHVRGIVLHDALVVMVLVLDVWRGPLRGR